MATVTTADVPHIREAPSMIATIVLFLANQSLDQYGSCDWTTKSMGDLAIRTTDHNTFYARVEEIDTVWYFTRNDFEQDLEDIFIKYAREHKMDNERK